ncbi:hypothetical protein PHMEG_00038526, partial [Phytophthora megakarya]
NLRPETNAFVSQNVPSTLKEVIELVERYEDSCASQPGNTKKDQSTNAKPQEEKRYGFLCHGGARVDDAFVSVFIDSGASFNAIAPEVAANLQLSVTTLPEHLRVKLCGAQRVSIPRRTATITLSMDGFP